MRDVRDEVASRGQRRTRKRLATAQNVTSSGSIFPIFLQKIISAQNRTICPHVFDAFTRAEAVYSDQCVIQKLACTIDSAHDRCKAITGFVAYFGILRSGRPVVWLKQESDLCTSTRHAFSPCAHYVQYHIQYYAGALCSARDLGRLACNAIVVILCGGKTIRM